MGKVLVTEQHLQDIAGAIREKLDSEDTYRPGDMAAAIRSIEGGYPEPTGTIAITQNGTANVKDYAAAAVNVPNSYAAADDGKVVSSGALVSQTARTVTENGTIDTTTNDSVTVNVDDGSAPPLPDAYQEVEWIGFDGNQYMLVENLPEAYLLQLLALNTTIKAESSVVGFRNSDGSDEKDFEVEFASGTLKLWVRLSTYGREAIGSYPSGSAVNTKREIFCALYGQTRKKFFIGTYYAGSSYTFFGRIYALKLFSFSRTPGIFTDVQPIREFIPCYRKSDGEIGLYELYTGTFYTNEGTGSFTKGADVT